MRHKQNYKKKEFDEFADGYWRSDKRFSILYNTFVNLILEKSDQVYGNETDNSNLISSLEKK